MPQAKTSKKKPATKVGGGGVGTRVSKFNLKLVIPIVLVVAALGGFYIFRKSGASAVPTNRSFNIPADATSVSGGRLIEKSNGFKYRLLDKSSGGWGYFQAPITHNQFMTSSQLCAQYYGSKGSVVLVVRFTDSSTINSKPHTYTKNGGEVCVDISQQKQQGKVANHISAWPDLSPAKPEYMMTLAAFFGKP